jgi:hypothetical protein
MFTNSPALAFSAPVPVAAMGAHTLAAAWMAHMPLLSVRADASTLAFLASIPMSTMNANAAASALLATSPKFAVLANTLAPAISAVVLLPSVYASSSSSAFYAMNPELLVLTYTASAAVLALVFVPAMRAKAACTLRAAQAHHVVLAETTGTRGWGILHNGSHGSGYGVRKTGGHRGADERSSSCGDGGRIDGGSLIFLRGSCSR